MKVNNVLQALLEILCATLPQKLHISPRSGIDV